MMALRPLQKMAQNAKRYEALREMAIMSESDIEKVFALLEDTGDAITTERFDIDADNLIAVLASLKEAK